jgi:anion-transporting  ArsA/GET3 family ATPase
LAQSLGIENQPGLDVAVAGVPGLSASMIDPRLEFNAFVLGSLDNVLAEGLLKNRLYQQLASNLNGSQEFTSLVRLLKAARDPRYDLIILDTPPTQNAVDFLRAPDRLCALFQDTVIGWFANPGEETGWIKRTIHRGTRLVTSALEGVTGSTFIAELKDFFTHISHLRGQISGVSQDVKTLMHDPKTAFVLVTGFDESKLNEALEFQGDLKAEKLKLLGVVVNRWFPEWLDGEGEDQAQWRERPEYAKLREFHGHFADFFRSRHQAFLRFNAQLGPDVRVVKLPDFKNTVQGLADLKQVAAALDQKWSAGS